ncbi:hypothetical protein APHAL10511_006706 [Amanita phalloides]|nr:hypothetical protein APHAL10511_006706 [Amanita phalloides]
MARFRAYTSDSGSDGDEHSSDDEKRARQAKDAVERGEECDSHHGLNSGDDSSSSSISIASQRKRKTKRIVVRRTGSRGATAEGDEGDPNEVVVRPPTSSPPPTDPTILPWAQQIGVDAQRMHVMQTSLFRMPEEAAALKALNEPLPSRPVVRKAILNRKHSRDSEGDGMRGEPRERASFAHDIDPAPYKPFQKYARVEGSSSIATRHEGAFFDAGLAFGRSFRVGWGPGGSLVHVGTICGPYMTPKPPTSPSIVKKTTVPLFPIDADQNASATLTGKLLQHHLSHTPITPDDAGVPLAYPSLYPTVPQASTSQPSLNFASFTSLFSTTDNSPAAQLFRLGSALFDPIDLQLPQTSSSDTTVVTPDVRNRIALLRRKAALSKWLKTAVKQQVESDLQTHSSPSTTAFVSASPGKQTSRPAPYTAADEAFTYLTGYQIKKAADVALDAGYLKLATLISQAGGDAVFRADVQSQLEIWEDEKVAQFIERGIKKVYMLLSGLLEGNGKDKDTDLCANLDWKRIFGLCLWYAEPVTASIADVFDSYKSLVRNSGGKVAQPFPSWYDQRQAKTPQPASSFLAWSNYSYLQQSPDIEDPLYALIRLHADPALSLSHVLDARSFGFGTSHADWSLCWHMYIILSRVMRVRDFADREELRSRARSKLVNGITSEDEGDDDEEMMEGHSPSADLLASSYAFQLETQGMLQEAVFVLLHVEGSVGREKAIKDLLARSAPNIDEWATRGLIGSLKIPLSWVNEAKALHALDTGDAYNAYELYISAAMYDPAHNIAVLELAPDAIIRRDLNLLKEILERFEGNEDKIDGWSIRGKILLDYVHIAHRITALQEEPSQDAADSSRKHELDELARRVPKIIALLPDVMSRRHSGDTRHAAALEQMVKELIGLVEKSKPSTLSQIPQSVLSGADEATKLGLVKGTGYARFLKSIEIGVYA